MQLRCGPACARRLFGCDAGAYGFAVGKSLGFGYVPPDVASPDPPFEIGILGERCAARLIANCAYDPANEKLRM